MKNIVFILLFIVSCAFWAQPGQTVNGLLELEKKVTFWDEDNTRKRSEGYLKVYGFGGVGEQYGKWKYYFEDGYFEEVSNYYGGKYNGKVVQYHPNHNKKFEGYFFLGVPDSISLVYYDNGKLAEEGMYNSIPDSIRDTTSKYWNIIEFLEPVKIGKWKTYYETGQPWMVNNFKPNDTTEYLLDYYTRNGGHQVVNGEGAIKDTFYSGNPKLQTTYKNGLKNGVYIEWNANGSKKLEGEYLDGEMSGNWVYYFLNSRGVHQRVSYLEGQKHGPFEDFMPNDTLAIKGNYKHGLKDGRWLYNFENGQTDMTGEFKDDLQHGHWKYYYPTGQLYYEGDYEDGKKIGAWQFYYGNGQMWREGSYRDDEKDGVWNTYYENGGDLMMGSYDMGKQHGAWTTWYENGQEKDMGSFDQGKMTARWTGWYPNGAMNYEGNYERDMKVGNWKFYTSKGKLKDDGNFKILSTKEGENTYVFTEVQEQSYKQGPWKSYSEIDGKLVSEGSYNRGRQSGNWKYYYPGGKMVAYENSYNNKGKLDGVSKTYSRRGKLNGVVNYKNGLKHGDVKTWDSKGRNLIQHLVYKNGVKVKDELNQTTFKYKN